jgi:hypothetical protein
MRFAFTEYQLPADMTEGDALDLLRLTGKAEGLRRAMLRYGRIAGRRDLGAALERVKSERRDILARYA